MHHSTVLDAVYSHNCITAIQPHTADQGEFSIGPVQTLIKVVHRETYRETESRNKKGSRDLHLVFSINK